MAQGRFAQIQSQEPALLTALYTLVGGWVAQAGPGHIPSVRALGTSVTVSGLQGILTRERVFSPATVNSGGAAAVALRSVTPWLAHGAEPALAMSLVGLLAGFLLQLVGGSPDLLQALGISAGLAGTQGVVTRQQVYSPRTVVVDHLAASASLNSPRVTGLTPPAAPVPAPPTEAAMGHDVTAVDPDTTPGVTSLLQRFRPEIRYDSLESFFADSVEIFTKRQGNLLRRQDGTVIAATTPTAGVPQLSLAYLGAQTYADGHPAAQGDYISEVGSDYVAQARQMHTPELANRIYGRLVTDRTGARWLQYWFFMYYDDPNFLGFGTHEGDLEMIQLRLDASGQPDVASYSQHRSGVRATWSQLEHAASPDGPVPVTYSARGSHANLLRSGTSVSVRSFVPDHNDGLGPKIRPDLEVVSDARTPWSLWPGSWGGTHASGLLGDIGVYANSPTAPNRHLAWRDPLAFHNGCDVPGDLPAPGQQMGLDEPAPQPPQLTIRRDAGVAVVDYAVPDFGATPAPKKLVVGLVPEHEPAPAMRQTVDIRAPEGTVRIPLPPGGAYAVHAVTHGDNGRSSATARVPL